MSNKPSNFLFETLIGKPIMTGTKVYDHTFKAERPMVLPIVLPKESSVRDYKIGQRINLCFGKGKHKLEFTVRVKHRSFKHNTLYF